MNDFVLPVTYLALIQWISEHTIWQHDDIIDMLRYHENRVEEIQLTLTLPELLALWMYKHE